jgi:hypothetical protein
MMGINKNARKRGHFRAAKTAPAKCLAFRHQLFILQLQLRFGFNVLWVMWNAIHGANRYALRLIVMPDALSATVWVNHINFITSRNRVVGALWLANVTVNALVSNHQCHVLNPLKCLFAAILPICPKR